MAALLLALATLTASLEAVVVVPSATANECSLEDCPGLDDGAGGGGGGGGGGSGGGTTPPASFNPPPPVNIQNVNVPDAYFVSFDYADCRQVPHLFYVSNQQPDYRVVPRGTPIALVGVMAPGTRANFGIYTEGSILVKSHTTQPAHSNCVVNDYTEYIDTSDLAPGYYYLWGSYVSVSAYYGGFPESSYGYPVLVHNRLSEVVRII